MNDLNTKIKQVLWSEVRQHFVNIEPELATIIDKLSPNKNHHLLQVDYSYGDIIFAEKMVHLPLPNSKDGTVPLSHPEIPQKIKSQLDYSSLPLAFLAERRGVEIYREIKERVHSIAFFSKGLNFGIWEFFDPPTPFSISAGARSMIMLPKVTDRAGYNALKKLYGIHSTPPTNSPFELWDIFRQLTQSKNFKTPWQCRVIYFPQQWVDKIRNDPNWLSFHYYILKRAWEHTAYNRNRFLYDEMWQSFFNLLTARKIRPASYVMDLFKHLIYIALGSRSMTAYKPFNGDEEGGPLDEILKIYLEDYKLDTYTPTLMMPCHFLANGCKDPIYYSLQIPTYWDSAPSSRDSISANKDLDYLLWIYKTFKEALIYGKISTSVKDIEKVFERVDFTFFHSDGRVEDSVLPASEMPKGDANLMYLPGKKGQYGERKFADRSSFAHGCVRVSLKC